MLTQPAIEPFDYLHASPEEYRARNAFVNLLLRERLPDDPPIPLEEAIQEMQNVPSYLDLRMWCAWDASHTGLLAEGVMQMLRTGENQHLASINIKVHPAVRRQGLGRQLLGLLTQTAQENERRLLLCPTYDRIPAGEAFMLRLGAQKGLVGHINQLRIADLDRQLLERWIEQGRQNSAEFELGLWEGPYPEEQLPAIAGLIELTNQQPMGDLEIEDMHFTPEQVRQIEQAIFSRGTQRWTYYVIERSTGKFAGYTETTWNPNRPEILEQDMTGVFSEYRNRGLGRWMKAVMLARVIKDRPQVKFVRTGNADSNAAMLKINNELGFKPYIANALWQVDIDHVLAYLGQSRTGGQ
jgi:mycothiol synthase